MSLLRLLAIPLLLILSACAPEPMVRPDAQAPPATVDIAALIEAQRYEAALRALNDALERTEDRRQRALLRLETAEMLLAAEQSESARALLDDLHDGLFDRRDQARLALARAELAALDGDPGTAAWMLEGIEGDLAIRFLPRLRALEQRLAAIDERGAESALRALEASLDQADFSPELALALLIEYPTATLAYLQARYRARTDLAPWLDLGYSARRYLLDDERLLPSLAAWQQRHPDLGYSAEEAGEWIVAWRQIQPAAARVAVILPGPDSSLARPGQSLRDGLMSAWSRQAQEQRPELIFLYSGDQPEQVMTAWTAARERGADLIIGPLGREQVDALLQSADPSLPLLLLNQPTDPRLLLDFPGRAHTLALTPEEEAELAAVRALVEGHSRALILRQDSDWGNRVAGAFSDTFKLGGGQVLRDMRYPANQVDHSILLEVLLGLDRSRERATALQRALGVSLNAEPARRTDADLIFLASRADDARAIRPQLKFFGAEDLAVMATSQVLSGAPDPRRDQDLDQVLIPLAPWFLDQGEAARQRQRAENLYSGLDNPTLSRLFALGADAVALLPWLDELRSDPALELAGRTGRLRLDDQGRIERDLPFVRLLNGRAQPQ